MRKLLAIPALALLLAATGCDSTTGPANRDLAGTWVSDDFAPAVVRMTISEIALEVTGAGSWTSAQEGHPFEVTGAHVDGRLSLIFTFGTLPPIGFEGEFTDEHVIAGDLVGSDRGFIRAPITFLRVQDE